MRIVTTAGMRSAEQKAVDAGSSFAELMDRAGRGVAQVAARMLGDVRGKRVVTLVGPGNNGGDGLVASAALAEQGAMVTIGLVGRRGVPDPARERARQRAARECDLSAPAGQAAFDAAVANADLVIDALFGVGLSRAVSGTAADALTLINNRPSRTPLLAVDVPSGLNPDTGQPDPLTPYATVTAT
ncbi:MAG: NAD(P)H-hydrate epimerase, partial [Dehalococcoidia bacterium]|nr:NAD(P)H-hydrate epimerase [Dehalococcoidia bacterium]